MSIFARLHQAFYLLDRMRQEDAVRQFRSEPEMPDMTCVIERHVEDSTPRLKGFCGGRVNPPASWEHLVAEYLPNAWPKWRALRKCIEAAGMVGMCGFDADTDSLCFRFSDGDLWAFSARCWGDLQAALLGDPRGYAAYAWDDHGKLPTMEDKPCSQ